MPGTYEIEIKAYNYATYRTNVTIQEGHNVVNFQLTSQFPGIKNMDGSSVHMTLNSKKPVQHLYSPLSTLSPEEVRRKNMKSFRTGHYGKQRDAEYRDEIKKEREEIMEKRRQQREQRNKKPEEE